MMNFYIFFVTVPNIEEGKKIARYLVENKLAACVNILPSIISIYEWNEKIHEDNEHLMIIKTTEEKNEIIIQKINELHSYEVPECVALKIDKGSDLYLKWIKEVVE